jgi:hypothetical protein
VAEASLKLATSLRRPGPPGQDNAVPKLPPGDGHAIQLIRDAGLVRVNQEHTTTGAADTFPNGWWSGEIVYETSPLLKV